jgi:hypothetical protein
VLASIEPVDELDGARDRGLTMHQHAIQINQIGRFR